MSSQRHTVLIIHCYEDSKFAASVARNLSEEMWDLQIDKFDACSEPLEDWPEQENWRMRMNAEISHAWSLLIVLSPSSVRSAWFRNAISIAVDKKKMFISLLLRECEVPPPLQIHHLIDFRQDEVRARMNLVEILKAHQKKQFRKVSAKSKLERVRPPRVCIDYDVGSEIPIDLETDARQNKRKPKEARDPEIEEHITDGEQGRLDEEERRLESEKDRMERAERERISAGRETRRRAELWLAEDPHVEYQHVLGLEDYKNIPRSDSDVLADPIPPSQGRISSYAQQFDY